MVLQSGSPRMFGARKATATRRLLVAFEVACTVVLLIFTALVSRSFSRVLDQDRAFRSDHLIVAEVNLLNPNYNQGGNSGEPARSAFVDRALARLRSTPGVEFAAITDNMPLAGENSVYSVYRQDNLINCQQSALHKIPLGEPLLAATLNAKRQTPKLENRSSQNREPDSLNHQKSSNQYVATTTASAVSISIHSFSGLNRFHGRPLRVTCFMGVFSGWRSRR